MKIGFTGTRQGMSAYQKEILQTELTKLCEIGKVNEFHHGGCVGADAEAHYSVGQMAPYTIYVHWPENRKHEARLSGPFVSEGRKPYLTRNEDIVKACDLLIAAPLTDKEQLRSGTWATIRYARRLGKEVLILRREPIKMPSSGDAHRCLEIRCQSKMGRVTSREDHLFCVKMSKEYEDWYWDTEKVVFNRTKPFGAN